MHSLNKSKVIQNRLYISIEELFALFEFIAEFIRFFSKTTELLSSITANPFEVDANNEEMGKYLLPEPFQNIFSSLIPQSHSRETILI